MTPEVVVSEIVIDLPPREPDVQAVPYTGKRDDRTWGNAGSIRLFMILSLFSGDHAVFYLFLEGAPSVDQVKRIATVNAEQWGDRLVVIEMGEAFDTVEAAADKAAGLRDGVPNANVVFPALALDDALFA